MALEIDLEIKSKPAKKAYVAAAALLGKKSTSTQRRIMRGWQALYHKFAITRFKRFSRGGGTWRPLAESTRRAKRRRLSPSRAALILRDSDFLLKQTAKAFDVLTLQNAIGVRVKYPRRKHKGAGMMVGELAEIHHFGRGRVPARPIFVNPPEDVRKRMVLHLRKWFERAIKS